MLQLTRAKPGNPASIIYAMVYAEHMTCTLAYLSSGRHFKDPALSVALAVEDDRSEVNMTYSLGTYFGGSDVVRMTVLKGPSAVIVKVCDWLNRTLLVLNCNTIAIKKDLRTHYLQLLFIIFCQMCIITRAIMSYDQTFRLRF